MWQGMSVSLATRREATTVWIFPFVRERFLRRDTFLPSTVPRLWPYGATPPHLSLPPPPTAPVGSRLSSPLSVCGPSSPCGPHAQADDRSRSGLASMSHHALNHKPLSNDFMRVMFFLPFSYTNLIF